MLVASRAASAYAIRASAWPSGEREQVCPHRGQPVAVPQLLGGGQRGRSWSAPPRGRAPWPRRRRGSASPRDRGPARPASGRAPRSEPSRCPRPAAASACTAAMAACSWYGTDRPDRQRLLDQRDALTEPALVPAGRGPAGRAGPGSRRRRVRDARRASVSSISASSPLISPASGSRACSQPRQPDRLLGQGHVVQVPSGGAQVALGEDDVEDPGDRDHTVGQLGRRRGSANGCVEPAQPGLGPADPLGHRGLRGRGTPGRSGRWSDRRGPAG